METSRQLILKDHSPSDKREPVASAQHRPVRATSNCMITGEKFIGLHTHLLYAAKENSMFAQIGKILSMYHRVIVVL